MPEFELLRNITLGQYLPTGSIVHRLDPRFKLIAFICLVAAASYNATYTGNVILLASTLLLLLICRVPVFFALSGIKPALPAILFLAIIQILIPPQPFLGAQEICNALLSWRALQLTDCTVRLVVVSALRFFQLILLTNLLTFTTTTTELAHGTESLLRPMQRLGVPAHELAMVVTIALRSVPTLARELERIMKAQASRGADFGAQGRLRFVRQTRHLLPLLVPLFLNALRRAEELVLAMEARCYVGGRGRTHLMQLRIRTADAVALMLTVAFAAFMLSYDFGSTDQILASSISTLLS
jgi:energy-coupling factor transport system permease protein